MLPMTWQSWPRVLFRQAGPGELLEERPSIACAVVLDDKLDWIVCRMGHETSRSENRANRAGDAVPAFVEEPHTARSPGRGWIDDGFATVAITLHLAKSLQRLDSDLQHQRDDSERVP